MRYFKLLILLLSVNHTIQATPSVARIWNEIQLNAIRIDAARPPVQARNLFHVSLAMYEAWAAYEVPSPTCLLGKYWNGSFYTFNGVPVPSNIDSARRKAISFAVYRLLYNRYIVSPNWATSKVKIDSTMLSLGYDTTDHSTNYASGNPAALGNYIAQQVITMGLSDGANQSGNYSGLGYSPNNPPISTSGVGNSTMLNVNSWQPLSFVTCIDQNGNPCGSSTPAFVCPHWGRVGPFAMPQSSAIHHSRNGYDWPTYYDPGTPPQLNVTDVNDTMSQFFKWGHEMVAIWSSHLDPSDTTMIDVSPQSLGNCPYYPNTLSGLQGFYNFLGGGQPGSGYALNPVTGMPYTPHLVKKGDFTRVISQFWADGPTSETPPGHWYVLFNMVSDYPGFQKKYEGVGPVLSDLEWDVKGYLSLGGAMHDAAIACWGIKGWYDSPRPFSMIRKMAALGQCSNPSLPSYHPGGLPLVPGYVELVTAGDPLAAGGNLNKIKLKAWKGFSAITYSGSTPLNAAGVGWILAENWMPYQRQTFVTPPFAGYVSGHSTYSRAGAVTMTALTGTPYFPGGMGEYIIPAYSNYLVFEPGPTTEIKLQWATYKDASDQASLSRIWGGIHPPFDDIPGRLIGESVGNHAFQKAKAIFQNNLMQVQIQTTTQFPVCASSSIMFTATATNISPGVTYRWKVNGVTVQNGNDSTFTASVWNNGDLVGCELVAAGYEAGSNLVTVQVYNCNPITLNFRLFLQGYYNGSETMRPVLYNQGVSSNVLLCDSVDIELRGLIPPYTLVEKKRAALMTNGNVTCTFTAPVDYYYMVIKHRNTVETWISEPLWLNTAYLIDISIDPSLIFGANETEVESGVYALFSGEINQDANVDLIDLLEVENDINSFAYGYMTTDINGDGNVDLLDYPIVETNVADFIYVLSP